MLLGFLEGMAVMQVGEVEGEAQEGGTPSEVMVMLPVALEDRAGEEEAIRSQMMASSTTNMNPMGLTGIVPRKRVFTGDLGVAVGRELEEVV